MDLSNKTITIDSMAVTTFPPETTVKVSVSSEVLPGMFQVIGQYNFKLEILFSGFDDPNLLEAIRVMLEQLPG